MMAMLSFLTLILFHINSISIVFSLDNGLGLLPPMGWNAWSAFGCDINETVVKEITDQMAKLDLRKYGYQYINLDDCWQGGRYSNGSIYANTTTFNASLKGLSNYIQSAGFKFGLYTSRGNTTCAGRPASWGHEQLDADTYSAWGVEFVKEDTCGGDKDDTQATCFAEYAKMRNALNSTGRRIYFSLCGNREWYAFIGAALGNSWRIAADTNSWPRIKNAIDTNAHYELHRYSGRGGWNDPCLLLANGPHHSINELQSRAQFSMWAIMSAPLLISSDVRNISAYTLETYSNKYVIEIDQDKAGKQGFRVQGVNLTTIGGNGTNIWSKELMDGSRAMVFLNTGNVTIDIICDSYCFKKAGFEYPMRLMVHDLWNGNKNIANVSSTEQFVVKNLTAGAGVAMYRMEPFFDTSSVPGSYKHEL
eukprot:471031_1